MYGSSWGLTFGCSKHVEDNIIKVKINIECVHFAGYYYTRLSKYTFQQNVPFSHTIQSQFSHNIQVFTTHQHFPHSEASLSSCNLRPRNHYSQTRACSVLMLLCFSSGQSVHCCIRHTPDIPRHIPHPLWLKVIPNSISYFLHTHTHTHTGSDLSLCLSLSPSCFSIHEDQQTFLFKSLENDLELRICVCVCVCVCVWRSIRGEIFY